jgi:hypothetical protein
MLNANKVIKKNKINFFFQKNEDEKKEIKLKKIEKLLKEMMKDIE